MIREQAKPADWLVENLQAQFVQGSEVMQISLDGKYPEELAHPGQCRYEDLHRGSGQRGSEASSSTSGAAQEAQQCEVRGAEKPSRCERLRRRQGRMTGKHLS